MGKVFILVLAANLVACATAPQPQLYHPLGSQGPAWAISGELNYITDDLQVLVNGEPAAVGKLWHSATPRQVRGSYEGHPVRAECGDFSDPARGLVMVVCDVYIDDARAAVLVLP